MEEMSEKVHQSGPWNKLCGAMEQIVAMEQMFSKRAHAQTVRQTSEMITWRETGANGSVQQGRGWQGAAKKGQVQKRAHPSARFWNDA